jgi:rare lipoprotein A
MRYAPFLFFFLTSMISTVTETLSSPHEKKTKSGKASYYHDKFEGRKTSSGDCYDKSDFTAAHRTLPFNSILLVTNTLNHRSVVVRVNDRGPFKKSRIVDLSHAAAMKIGMVPFGIVPVQIKQLHLLDKILIADSLLLPETVWNCFAKSDSLRGTTIQLWQTTDWKHAFYMASNLQLENVHAHVLIKVSTLQQQKTFVLLITDISDKEIADKLITRYRREGFTKAVITPCDSTVNQHADR